MKVLKFGGTSVGSADRIKKVAGIVTGKGRNIVVLSAMAGTTNTLVEIVEYFYRGDEQSVISIVDRLEEKYKRCIADLYSKEASKQSALSEVRSILNLIRGFKADGFSSTEERIILAQGEMMSTAMMNIYLHEQEVNSVVVPALDYMKIDSFKEPDLQYIKDNLTPLLEAHSDADLYITQGYICRNHLGEIDNLQRGGSDYTASLIGAVINAEEIEIWTDIDGLHNNDPRYVDNTEPIELLNFEEAAELAYFGAKILHPTCIQPAKNFNIPVRLLNTMNPEAHGTLVGTRSVVSAIKAIAAKDYITAIGIKSDRMLPAYGFLHRVFETFEAHKTVIDMIATSEVGVSIAIDNDSNLQGILADLQKIGTVSVDSDMVILCVVGDLEWHNAGYESRVTEALKDIPVRMISYGGSDSNISFLISKEDKVEALNKLNEQLFQ